MIKVHINSNREVINFLWGYGYTENYPNRPIDLSCDAVKKSIGALPEEDVLEIDFDLPKEGTKYKGFNRYFVDENNHVVRRSDSEIESLPEFELKAKDDFIEFEKNKEAEISALEKVKENYPDLSARINKKIADIKKKMIQ